MAKKTNKIDDQFGQVEEALSKTEQYIEVIVNCPEVSISSHLPPSSAT